MKVVSGHTFFVDVIDRNTFYFRYRKRSNIIFVDVVSGDTFFNTLYLLLIFDLQIADNFYYYLIDNPYSAWKSDQRRDVNINKSTFFIFLIRTIKYHERKILSLE